MSTAASPSSPISDSRPIVGVENRERTATGIAVTKNTTVATTITMITHQYTSNCGDPPYRNSVPTTSRIVPMTVHE